MNIPVIRVGLSLSFALLCSTAAAQSGLSTSGSGLTGFSGLSGLSSGSSLSSTTGTSNSSTGTSGTSSSTARSTGTSNSTTAGSSTTGNAAQGFIGGNATQAFVGGAREATNQQSMNRQFQAFQSAQTTSTSQSQQTGTPRRIRTTLNIGFNFPPASIAQQTGKLANANSLSMKRFSATRPELSGINVSLTGEGVAVLTGSSPTSESSRLAANLIRLQPGVRKIENQIAVTP